MMTEEVCLNASEFKYLAEGSAHLVVAYDGPPNTHLTGRVIRVMLENAVEDTSVEEHFVSSIIGNLLGSKYVDAGKVVPCTSTFLQELSEVIAAERRVGKMPGRIDLSRTSVQVMRNNATFLGPGSWCVEIKPKYCLKSRSKLLPFKYNVKYSVPFFRMMFSEEHTGGYSPDDFFSADESRIKMSLMALWSSKHKWLRVYRNAEIITTESDDSNVDISPILTQASIALSREPECLKSICKMQSLEYLDSYGAKLVYDELERRGKGSPDSVHDRLYRLYSRPSPWQAEDIGTVTYSSPEIAATSHNDPTFERTVQSLSEIDDAQLEIMLADYMLSSISKDLSIMVCLREVVGGWAHDVNVVDVGIKPESKVQRWFDRDRQIVEEFLRSQGASSSRVGENETS